MSHTELLTVCRLGVKQAVNVKEDLKRQQHFASVPVTLCPVRLSAVVLLNWSLVSYMPRTYMKAVFKQMLRLAVSKRELATKHLTIKIYHTQL